MDIKLKAKEFAIKAHYGQMRKSDKSKPMIVHLMDAANILESYNFDDNVVAAAYLHDTLEDTNCTQDDILNNFGSDILSLVLGDTEIDKSLSWEERKEQTIKEVKELDMRHKAIVCADKISNLEDLQICIEKEYNYDFSSFNKGYDKQKWYYESIYESLIYNESNIHPMFKRLKELIDYVFNNYTDEYLENIIFENNLEDLKELKILHYKKKELIKLRRIFNFNNIVIEFTGTPRTGKTTLINNLKDFFKKGNFSINYIEEFTTSKIYKEKIYPSIKDYSKEEINKLIPKYTLDNLNKVNTTNNKIIIVDRCLVDRLIWMDRLYNNKGITKKNYNLFIKEYIPIIKDNINIVIATYTDPLTSIKRDYYNSLALENRSFLSISNIEEYNNSLSNIEDISKNNSINMYYIDTTNKSEREVSIRVCNYILDSIKSKYIEEINKYIVGVINE